MDNTLFFIDTILIQNSKRYNGLLRITDNTLSFTGDKLSFKRTIDPAKLRVTPEMVKVPGLLFRRKAEGCAIRGNDDLELRFVMDSGVVRQLQQVLMDFAGREARAEDMKETQPAVLPTTNRAPAETETPQKPEDDAPLPEAEAAIVSQREAPAAPIEAAAEASGEPEQIIETRRPITTGVAKKPVEAAMDAIIGSEAKPSFMNWLEANAPESDVQLLCLLYPRIDSLCAQRGLSDSPVQSITDIGRLEGIRDALNDPALLPDRLRKFHPQIQKAMTCLMDYARFIDPEQAPSWRETASASLPADGPAISRVTAGAQTASKKDILCGILPENRFKYWLTHMSPIRDDAQTIKAVNKSIADIDMVSSKRDFYPGEFVGITDPAVLDRLRREFFGPSKSVRYPPRAEKNIQRAIDVFNQYLEDCGCEAPSEPVETAAPEDPAAGQTPEPAAGLLSDDATLPPVQSEPATETSAVSTDASEPVWGDNEFGRKIESIEEDPDFDFGNANPQQRIAIQTTEGPLLIIAGPGTGKTYTLIKRIVYLVRRREVDPSQIMVVTFTDKAARELISRVSSEFAAMGLQVDLSTMYIGTFHAICRRILSENASRTRLSKRSRQLDDFDQKYLIFSNHWRFRRLPDYNLLIGQTKGVWRQADLIARYLNQMTEEMVDIDALEQDEDPAIASLAGVARLYQNLLEQEQCIDFSGLLTETYALLEQNPDVLAKLQERIRYIMVDEYQDTNYIQEQLVFLLGKKHNNICVVGDDDQGLYRFRGATIRNILEFPRRFGTEGCARVDLTTNYRSEPGIIDFYNTWMDSPGFFEWGRFRFDKHIVPGKRNPNDGPTVLRCTAQGSVDAWAEKLCRMILDMKASGFITNFNQVAFLCRSVKNDNIRQLIALLESAGISVYAPRARMFFERREVSELLGCLMLCFPNYCARLRETDFEYHDETLSDYYRNVCLPAAEALTLQNSELATFIRRTRERHAVLHAPTDYAFTGLLYRLLRFEPFRDYAASMLGNVIEERPARNISTLLWVLNKYEYNNNLRCFNPVEFEGRVEKLFNMHLRFMWKGGINEYEDENDYAPSGCVSFMTIHQSKGLEFPVVLVDSLSAVPRAQRDPVMDVIEAKYYRRKPFEPSDAIRCHDFWRLYYTAFSRAKNLLVLTCQEKKGGRQSPSTFFRSMYLPLPEYCETALPSGSADEVRLSNLKKRYSFTANIALYEGCARQYRFFRELGFVQKPQEGPAFGTLVHQTIEDINRAILNRRPEDVTRDNIRRWLNQNYARLSLTEHVTLNAAYLNSAFAQVLRYAENLKDGLLHGDWNRLAAVEQSIALNCPDYILDGAVDMIVDNGDSMEIIDFKSEKRPASGGADEHLEVYRQQLCLYAHLVEQKYRKPVSRMRLYFTAEEAADPVMTFESSEDVIESALRCFDGIIQRIQKGEFEGSSGDSARCQNCEMRFYCGKEKPH